MSKKNKKNSYFVRYIRIAPLSLALWRGVEASELAKYKLEKPVLDIGCGFGEFGGVFFEAKVEMGVDINKDDLLLAAATGKYERTKWADARNLPFKNNSYQTVISVSTFEHIKDGHQGIFREIFRILKPNGRLIFTVPTAVLYDRLFVPRVLESLGLKKIARDYFRLYNKAFKHVFLPEPNEWKRLVKKAGFVIEVFQGTIPTVTFFLFELFLPIAFASQIGRVFFGTRFVLWPNLRVKILKIFERFVYSDPKNLANIIIVARKAKISKYTNAKYTNE